MLKYEGDLTWLFGGDNVINMRQVRRFKLQRNPAAGDTLIVHYIDGSTEAFRGNECTGIWKALVKASESTNIRA